MAASTCPPENMQHYACNVHIQARVKLTRRAYKKKLMNIDQQQQIKHHQFSQESSHAWITNPNTNT